MNCRQWPHGAAV
jgi:hypothetical protein